MIVRIFPYKMESKSAISFAEGLGAKLLKHDPEKSTFKGKKDRVVINWGYSQEFPIKEVYKCKVFNKPESVALASNKLSSFQKFGNVLDGKAIPRHPRWTTQIEEAKTWQEEGRTIFARTILNSNSGKGIIEYEPHEKIEGVRDGTLLVEYIPKKIEYRIHVFGNEVFDIQRKMLKYENRRVEGNNWRIRNLRNGFIFARNELGEVPEDVKDQAILAVDKLDLDFGAVDVIWNERQQKAYVLEVNTAPGLEGTTLENYVKKFKEKFA